MNIKPFSILLTTISFILFLSCSNDNKPDSKNDSPYEYLDNKQEQAGESYNQMTLYACGDNPEITTMQNFCLDKKQSFTDGVFHILVFFDSKENAVFPSNPITGGYIEEEPSTHIKAIYTYNRLNGYSKLDFYQQNYWESPSNTYDIK